MARQSWKLAWGRVAHPAARSRALAAAFVAACVALVPAPSTLADGDLPQTPALLAISEWLADPPEGESEVEGEWVELIAIQGGSLGGISISDHDGEVDFTFANASSAATGEFLVIHNGHPALSLEWNRGTHYFANKTSWTFDNSGDDLELLSASGDRMDRVAFGIGPAVDGGGPSEDEPLERPPPAATMARVNGVWSASTPTPGAANVALQDLAQAPPFRLAWVAALGPLHFVMCNAGDGPWTSRAWELRLGNRSYPIAAAVLEATACLAWGPPPAPPVAGALALEFGAYLVEAGRVDGTAPGAPAELRDPWGASRPIEPAPPFAVIESQSLVLWSPCGCPEIWKHRALVEFGAQGQAAMVSGVDIFEAGAALRAVVLETIGNSSQSLDVNAYLLTSDEVTAALTGAGTRGVQVRLLIDGSPEGIPRVEAMPSQAQLAEMEAAGVEVRTMVSGLGAPARDHAKYLVADGERVLVLTENLVGAALSSQNPNTGYAASFRSTAIAGQLRTLFNWDFSSGAPLTGLSAVPSIERAPIPESANLEGGARAQLAVSPTAVGAWDLWVQMIGSAREEIVCASLSADVSVLGPAGPVGRALLEAAARNVSVKVLLATPANSFATNGTGDAARTLASEAAARNLPVELRLDPRGANNESKMHAKVLVVDRRAFLVGSHNLVRAAAVANREVSIMIEDEPASIEITASILRTFEQAVSQAVEGLPFDGSFSYGGLPAPSGPANEFIAHPYYWLLPPGATFCAWGGLRDRRRRRARRLHLSAFWIGVAIARSLWRPRRRRNSGGAARQVVDEAGVEPHPLRQPLGEPAVLPPSAFDLMERG